MHLTLFRYPLEGEQYVLEKRRTSGKVLQFNHVKGLQVGDAILSDKDIMEESWTNMLVIEKVNEHVSGQSGSVRVKSIEDDIKIKKYQCGDVFRLVATFREIKND